MKYYKNKIDGNFIPSENCLIISVGTRDDRGIQLTASTLDWLLTKNFKECSTVVFRGGEKDPDEINQMAYYIRHEFPKYKIAWFSNDDYLDSYIKLPNFDYIKLGGLKVNLGDYHHECSNQKVYKVRRVRGGKYKLSDITEKFYE